MEQLTNDPGLNELEALEKELAGSVRAAEFGERAPDAGRIWAKVRLAGESELPREGFSGKALRRWVGYSAALAVALYSVGLGIRYKTDHNKSLNTGSIKTYETGIGKRANLRLADGTEIILAPSTNIQVDGRSVTLNGQAMFKVIPNIKSPFVVKSNGTSTTVLGTEFVVRAYSGEGKTRIVVQSGRVAVQPPNLTSGNSIVVGASDVVTVSASGVTDISRNGWLKGDLSWTNGRLIFSDTPLADVLPELSRWTGLDFRVASPEMLRRPLTTSVTSQLTEEEIRAIADALDARYQREGRVVTFVSTR